MIVFSVLMYPYRKRVTRLEAKQEWKRCNPTEYAHVKYDPCQAAHLNETGAKLRYYKTEVCCFEAVRAKDTTRHRSQLRSFTIRKVSVRHRNASAAFVQR
jgi:hypothetical protein